MVRDKIKKFEREVRKNIVTALVAAFGFIIALVWKDVILEYMGQISGLSPFQGQLVTAFLVTLLAVLAIIFLSKLAPSE